MKINYLSHRPARNTTGYRIAGSKLEEMLNKLNMGGTQKGNQTSRTDKVSLGGSRNSEGPEGFAGPLYITAMNEKVFHKLNEGNFTQIGGWIELKGGIVFKASDVPKLDVDSLSNVPTAEDNMIDFGSARYYKYTNSAGKSLAIFSMPEGALCRPVSEEISGHAGYDRETEKYINFWNALGDGQPFFEPPNSPYLPEYGGYSNEDLRGYLDEAGISKGFFTVKIGARKSEFFYSDSKHNPIHKKEDYDFRYYTMTSPDFSYEKSVFKGIEPGTEITISGEKYTLKEDLTLDIPYGTDIFDIQMPKYKSTGRTSAGIDVRV